MGSPAYDVIIVGASFSGLTLAHHLPKHLSVLVLDRKRQPDAVVESTGLITKVTRDLFATFTDIDACIPNQITTIGVVSPNYDDYFFSQTETPWIYSTDTPRLIKQLAKSVPSNVTVLFGHAFVSCEPTSQGAPVTVIYKKVGDNSVITTQTRCLVGADGARSRVAQSIPQLDRHTKFLVGVEKVFYGDILLGPAPEATVYHFWFGTFSLGYGGWLSPTVINGKKAFRVGLAKLEKDARDTAKLETFIAILQERQVVRLSENGLVHGFGSVIPIGGVLSKTAHHGTLLLGDAAGYCGAFAADGIKGALVSAMAAARRIPEYLNGDIHALTRISGDMQQSHRLLSYYTKQVRYRWLWDRMRRDRTFHAMYAVIKREKEHFLDQFCDNTTSRKSLIRVVLKLRNVPQLVVYGWYILIDMISPL
jgi:flavin-dependent dehydrogenase